MRPKRNLLLLLVVSVTTLLALVLVNKQWAGATAHVAPSALTILDRQEDVSVFGGRKKTGQTQGAPEPVPGLDLDSRHYRNRKLQDDIVQEPIPEDASAGGNEQISSRDGTRDDGAAIPVKDVVDVIEADTIAMDAQDSPPPVVVDVPPVHPKRRYAFVSMINNEEYVDGALVLAWSLTQTSKLLKAGDVGLVLLVPQELHASSRERLYAAGWNELRDITSDLAQPKAVAKWRLTFNKLHIFNMTDFERVVFWDSDVVCHEDPDRILAVKLPNDGTKVGAIGAKGDSYFKTGNMVIIPRTDIFNRMVAPVLAGKYNHPSGRDGLLIREFFNGSFEPIAPVWSQYRRPWQDLKGQHCFHYRGEFKPWMPEYDLPRTVNAKEYLEFGPSWRVWWTVYTKMHLAVEVAGKGRKGDVVPSKRSKGGYGDGAKPDPTDPPGTVPTATTHLWLQRHTKTSYLRRIMRETVDVQDIKPRAEGGKCESHCVKDHAECKKLRCNVAYTQRNDPNATRPDPDARAPPFATVDFDVFTYCDVSSTPKADLVGGQLSRCQDFPTPWPQWEP